MTAPGKLVKRSLNPDRSLRANIPTILLLVFVLFYVFACRIIYSPLLLSIEESFGLSHAQAATFYIFITIGYAGMMILSGFVAAAIGHRRTIQVAVLLSASGLIALSLSSSLWGIRICLVLVGMGTGLYFPSGIPILNSLVEDKDEGKALALHEIGPNLSLVVVPIAAIFGLRFLNWQAILFVLACTGVVAGILFSIFARGGRFHGKPPHLANARVILNKPSFWIMSALFSLAAGAGLGVFAMTPTYLVAERGMDRELVNTLVGMARISNLVIIFVAGLLVDRFGARRVISVIMVAAGLATVALGSASRPLLIAAMFLQPLLIACYFPAGFTMISRIAPREMHNLTISFVMPVSYAVGAGLVPYFFGLLGDRQSFALGFVLYGVLLASSAVLPFFLKLEKARG
jgi:NNP family nitrate/nitrite transporter-like MFS transporter